ncbi:MAG: site-specific integrase, partial [Pseudomonadota bacterium]
MAGLRLSEIRAKVRDFFEAHLDRYQDWIDRRGLSDNALADAREEMLYHVSYLELGSLDPRWLPVARFKREAGVSDAEWQASQPRITHELRKGRRDMLRDVLAAADGDERYLYGNAAETAPAAPGAAEGVSAQLGRAVEDFISENARTWSPKTTSQNRAYLRFLLEYFGPDRRLATITRSEASEVKKLLLCLPSSRNTKPELKDLPLREVVEAKGHKTISTVTINSHIQMFAAFFDWALRHGHAPQKLFDNMKVAKPKTAEAGRKPFSPDQMALLLKELTDNPSGLVRKESHKWGMLLGMFTGARLNEICQLSVSEIRQDGEIWFLDISADGEDGKRLKTKSSKRRVPLHSELIRLGFLKFRERRSNGPRLFPDYSFSKNGGYGRNLGRWCNESFLPKLGLKDQSLVYHSFRHTMVTRLGHAGVAEPIIQSIVGHARSGVTQEVYLREGYTLAQ